MSTPVQAALSRLHRAYGPSCDLQVEAWSPGDGATRYRLTSDGGGRNVTDYVSGRGEFLRQLGALTDVLEHKAQTDFDAKTEAAAQEKAALAEDQEAADLTNKVAEELGWLLPKLEQGCYHDVRLQLHEDGSFALHTGDPSYDTDHTGFWGTGCVRRSTPPAERVRVATKLVEQALDHRAQGRV